MASLQGAGDLAVAGAWRSDDGGVGEWAERSRAGQMAKP